MNPERTPEPGKSNQAGDEKFMEEKAKTLIEKNIQETREGKPEKWQADKEVWQKQYKEIRPLKKEESESAQPCRHCESLEHRSYNCPLLKDPEYVKKFMKGVPGYPPKESQDKS